MAVHSILRKSEFHAFIGSRVNPPLPVYIPNGTFIRLQVAGTVASVRVKVSGMLIDGDGDVVEFGYEEAVSSDRSTATFFHPMAAGFLLAYQVTIDSGSVEYGAVMARADLMNAASSSALLLKYIVQGYLSDTESLSWDNTTPKPLLETQGNRRTIPVSSPAAGASWTQTVPSEVFWRINSIKTFLVTESGGNPRIVKLRVSDGTNVYLSLPTTGQISSSTSRAMHWMPGVGEIDDGNDSVISPIPHDLLLGPGEIISVGTNNITPGDQWSLIHLRVQEYIV